MTTVGNETGQPVAASLTTLEGEPNRFAAQLLAGLRYTVDHPFTWNLPLRPNDGRKESQLDSDTEAGLLLWLSWRLEDLDRRRNERTADRAEHLYWRLYHQERGQWKPKRNDSPARKRWASYTWCLRNPDGRGYPFEDAELLRERFDAPELSHPLGSTVSLGVLEVNLTRDSDDNFVAQCYKVTRLLGETTPGGEDRLLTLLPAKLFEAVLARPLKGHTRLARLLCRIGRQHYCHCRYLLVSLEGVLPSDPRERTGWNLFLFDTITEATYLPQATTTLTG